MHLNEEPGACAVGKPYPLSEARPAKINLTSDDVDIAKNNEIAGVNDKVIHNIPVIIEHIDDKLRYMKRWQP